MFYLIGQHAYAAVMTFGTAKMLEPLRLIPLRATVEYRVTPDGIGRKYVRLCERKKIDSQSAGSRFEP